MNAPNLGTENPMTDKEILVERVGLARTAFRIASMTIERDVRLHELTDEEEDMLIAAAIDAAAIASTSHSERVEAAYREGWRDGERMGLCGIDEDWKYSETRKALTRNVSDKE